MFEVDGGGGVVVFVYGVYVGGFVYGSGVGCYCFWGEWFELCVVQVYQFVDVEIGCGVDECFGKWCGLDQEELMLVSSCKCYVSVFVYCQCGGDVEQYGVFDV